MKLTNIMKNFLFGLYSSLKRFPVTIGLSMAVATLLIIISEVQESSGYDSTTILNRIALVLALGIPLSLCIKLIFEKNEKINSISKALVWILGAASLILYYFFLIPDLKIVSGTRYIAISIALYLIFVILPYFYAGENLELYVIKLLTRFFITALYSAVLYLGMAAILFTINKLLSVYMPGKMYYYVWLIIAGVFIPSFFLAGIPTCRQQLDSADYPKLLRILLLYIVMPLITVYTAILYIYFAKIIITLKWPEGLVSNLTLWYSVISAGVIFLVSPLSSVNKWVKTFILWFVKLVLPILVIMFISIGMRIQQYGVTENRYFVVLLGLWVSGIMIYLNIAKSRRNIILPLSLAIIAVLSVCGPWSAYSISKYSQNKRFENIVTKNDMVKNNVIVKAPREVSNVDKAEISSILSYFSDKHSLNDVKYLPKDLTLDRMENIFGFTYQQPRYPDNNNGYFSYNAKMPDRPVDIRGYDYLFNFGNYQQQMSIKETSLEVKYSFKDKKLQVLFDGNEIYSGTLEKYIKQLHDKYPTGNTAEISNEDMTFTDGNEKVKLKYVISNIYGSQDKAMDKIKIDGVSFYVLIKVM